MAYSSVDRERWVREDPATKRADRDDFARDRARLVHSASLRRLSAKTQVVQPGDDDFVRNRLTHSLEVAQIGREFGQALGCSADVVDSACLAHDLGHPPFGHNGERALDEIARDIGGFEGNAQTLRLLTRLEPKRVHPDGRPAGLNLTRATLDAVDQVPVAPGRRGRDGRYQAKFGVYADDLPVFEWFRDGRPDGQRCIEADVMDWSDDVAYSVHDVEDAIASGRLDVRRAARPHRRRLGARGGDRPLRRRPRGRRARCRAGTRAGQRSRAHGIRRVAGGPGGAQGHDVAAHRPVRPRGRGGHPRAARRRAADPLRRRPGGARRDPGRVRGAQGAWRPTSSCTPRSGSTC